MENFNVNKHHKVKGWIFIIPALALLGIFIMYPVVSSLIMTTQNIQGHNSTFIGLDNFRRMFSDQLFRTTLFNTFLFLIIQVPIMLILAIILANILNNPKLKFRGFFRLAIFLPAVTSLVAYSVLFQMMFATNSIVNNFLMSLNLISNPIEWLNDPFWARFLIIIALLWRWTGFNMVFYLAGLQNIPQETHEAAKVDGANAFQKFFYIIIPQLKPIILFTAVMSTIGTLQLFDEPMNLTGGGPGTSTMTISQYIYNVSFVFMPDFGYAATLSYTVVFIVAIISIIQFKVLEEK